MPDTTRQARVAYAALLVWRRSCRPLSPRPRFGNRFVQADRESAHEIGAADDPDNAAISNHRDALYAARREDLGNFSEVGLLAHRDHRRRHDGSRVVVLRAQPGEK